MHLKRILIYTGPGTEKTNILHRSLTHVLDTINPHHKFHVDLIEEASSISPALKRGDTELFILPGGRDLPYVEHIKTDVIRNIKDYIHTGGSYLGICAGAYFSCQECIFDKNGPLEVVGPREMALFSAGGVGPVYPGFKYNSAKGSIMAPLEFHSKSNNLASCFAYFNGGGAFQANIEDTDPNYEIISSYKDLKNKAAIVYGSKGLGKVLLSFVHPEMSYKFLDKENYTELQWNDMVAKDDGQFQLWKWIINKLVSFD